jgi:hypothetical protein
VSASRMIITIVLCTVFDTVHPAQKREQMKYGKSASCCGVALGPSDSRARTHANLGRSSSGGVSSGSKWRMPGALCGLSGADWWQWRPKRIVITRHRKRHPSGVRASAAKQGCPVVARDWHGSTG